MPRAIKVMRFGCKASVILVLGVFLLAVANGDARSQTAKPTGAQAAKGSAQDSGKARFTKDTLGIIDDSQTGLQWYVGPDSDTPFLQAQSWAKGLSLRGGEWRLPTIAELKGLYGSGVTPIVWHDGSPGTIQIDPIFAFPRSSVWSSKTRGSSEALIFQFDNARVEWVLQNDGALRAFAVRSRK